MRFRLRHRLTLTVFAGLLGAASIAAEPAGVRRIVNADLQKWLTYLSSDQMQGRQVYTEGLGLAAAYIADHLNAWGIKPGGDNGTYFQDVKVLGIETRSHSTVTVTVNGQSRTFKDGEGVTFPKNQGRKQVVSAPVAFVGYGLTVPELGHDDYKEGSVTGRIVLYIGSGPQGVGFAQNRLVNARGRSAIELHHAVGAIGAARPRPAAPAAAPVAGAGAPSTPGAAPRQPPRPPAPATTNRGDFQTVERLDHSVPPSITANDELLAFVFQASGQNYADLKAKADRREPLPRVDLAAASIAINVDADYDIVQTRLTRNVVGVVEGRDPRLKDTFVLVGAHYDHVGYRQTPQTGAPGAFGSCPGQTRPTPAPGDIVFNGADDDGSGTVATLAIAQAYAKGPKPKRSLMFVWHAGEEAGLLGSRYMADYPEVPIEKMAAQLNIDMVGRNRCDDSAEANTVYLVGSDRISTELHNVSEDANAGLRTPMTLSYEMNDPADPESLYTRSDHYSYAAKGIPVIFYTTGLHRDYHYVTDEVNKIAFPKLAHIAQLVYATSWEVANLDHLPARDNKGPRKGKGQGGRIPLSGQ